MHWKLRINKACCLLIQEMRDPGLHWGGASVLEPGRLSWDPIIGLLQLWLYHVYLVRTLLLGIGFCMDRTSECLSKTYYNKICYVLYKIFVGLSIYVYAFLYLYIV